MQDLQFSFWHVGSRSPTRKEPGLHALGVWSLSCWITRKSCTFSVFFMHIVYIYTFGCIRSQLWHGILAASCGIFHCGAGLPQLWCPGLVALQHGILVLRSGDQTQVLQDLSGRILTTGPPENSFVHIFKTDIFIFICRGIDICLFFISRN